MTQNDMVLDYIRRFGSITPLEALADLGCMRLGARVYDLKRLGHSIVSETEHSTNRFFQQVSYSRYKLGDVCKCGITDCNRQHELSGHDVKVNCDHGTEEISKVCGCKDCDADVCFEYEYHLDLIEQPEVVQVDCWMNVYKNRDVSVNMQREDCDKWCNSANQGKRIACIHIVQEVTVGEGLKETV